MDSKQEIINMINGLSDDQLQKALTCIKEIFLLQEKAKDGVLDEEQKELISLLDYTIDTGRGDFAEKHDHYLYSRDT